MIRPLGATLQFVREDVPDLDAAGTGVEYWRDGLERRMSRWWVLTWQVHRASKWGDHRA